MRGKMEWHGQLLEFPLDQRVLILDHEGKKNALLLMPGLDLAIMIRIEGRDQPVWHWNGDRFAPTFDPFIRTALIPTENKEVTNIVYVKDGMIEYSPRCTHAYAGRKMSLPQLCDWPEELRMWEEIEDV